MIADSQSDSDEDDDTEDEDDRTQAPTAEDTTDDAETPSTVPAAAVDACEVCFVAPRDARFALVSCVFVSPAPTQSMNKAVAILFVARPSQRCCVCSLYYILVYKLTITDMDSMLTDVYQYSVRIS